jgi:hypothetical protein
VILYDLPAAEYRQNKALGSTDIKNILRSPAHYLQARFDPPEETEAMKFGTAVHAYLLERPTFFSVYAVEPEGLLHKGRNPWKKDWEAFKEANKDKIILDRADWEAIKGIQREIQRDELASKLFEICQYEVSCIGEELKGRFDMLCDDYICDLKTTENAEEFESSIQKMGYYRQAAQYLDLAEASDGKRRQFLWIVAEKKKPNCCMVYHADDDMIERGQREYKAGIEIYRRCVANNYWPGYESRIRTASLKPWFKGILG